MSRSNKGCLRRGVYLNIICMPLLLHVRSRCNKQCNVFYSSPRLLYLLLYINICWFWPIIWNNWMQPIATLKRISIHHQSDNTVLPSCWTPIKLNQTNCIGGIMPNFEFTQCNVFYSSPRLLYLLLYINICWFWPIIWNNWMQPDPVFLL
jgi:uncharacterized protein YlbG (UPF0298 family)